GGLALRAVLVVYFLQAEDGIRDLQRSCRKRRRSAGDPQPGMGGRGADRRTDGSICRSVCCRDDAGKACVAASGSARRRGTSPRTALGGVVWRTRVGAKG